MGIKNLPWKKIGGILFIIATIITIVTNLKFVWNCLKFLGNIVVKICAPLTNSIVRDALLFVLIVGIIVWLYLISKKLRNIPQAEKSEKMEEWQFEWDSRHSYVLENIVEIVNVGETSIRDLFEGYKENFPESSEKEYNLIVYDLEESKLIWQSSSIGDKKFYATTDKGRRHYMKGIRRGYKE